MVTVRRLAGGALAALVGIVAAAGPVVAHPIHSTLTEIVYEDAGHAVRVSIRVFADDFGAAVARHAGPGAAGGPAGDDAVQRYVAARLTVADRSGRPIPLRWCGQRRQGNLMWLCLSGTSPAGLAGGRVRNRLLVDAFDDQVNIVQTRAAGRRQTILFSGGDAWKALP